MIAPPVKVRQLSLSLDLPPSIPLVHIETAQNLLALDADHVCEAIEIGVLIAFNIATPDARRPETRIYRDSLRDAHVTKRLYPGTWCHPQFAYSASAPAEVVAACLPPARTLPSTSGRGAGVRDKLVPPSLSFFPLASLARRWSCSPDHLQNLIDAGCLQTISRARMGANGSAQILRASAETFLTANCESFPSTSGRGVRGEGQTGTGDAVANSL